MMLDREKIAIALFENHNSNLVSMGPGAWTFVICFAAVVVGLAVLDEVLSTFIAML